MRLVWSILTFAIVAIVTGIRLRLLQLPLERDEGEYAYAGQLLLQRISPYRFCYTMKFPGTHAAYALIMSIFGQTPLAIHLGLLLVNVATIVLIFFLGRRLFGFNAGLTSAATFAILSVSSSVLGFAAHATHFVILTAIAGTLLLLNSLDRPSYAKTLCSGLLFGLAILMKQPGASFAAFGFLSLLVWQWRVRTGFREMLNSLAIFVIGVFVPFGFTCFILSYTGTFNEFWYWTVHQAREYSQQAPLHQAARAFVYHFGVILEKEWPFFLFAFLGGITFAWRRKYQPGGGLILMLLAFSVIALGAGLYFREHYFVLVLPAVSLLAGVFLTRSVHIRLPTSRLARFLPVAVFGAAALFALWSDRDIYFNLNRNRVSHRIYGVSPFPESIKIGDYLREHSLPTDTIAVLGSEPQIYFYAQRRSATGYVYTYPLMEKQVNALSMQHEMEREIEAARPAYIVFVSIRMSWLTRPESIQDIFDWAGKYCDTEYELVALIDIVNEGKTDYYWGAFPSLANVSSNLITIYKRRF